MDPVVRLVAAEDQAITDILLRLQRKEVSSDVMAKSILYLSLREPRLKSKVVARGKEFGVSESAMNAAAAQCQIESKPVTVRDGLTVGRSSMWAFREIAGKLHMPKELQEAWDEGPPSNQELRNISRRIGFKLPSQRREKPKAPPLADRLLTAIEGHPGLENRHIAKVLGGAVTSKEANRTLGELEKQGKIVPARRKRRNRDEWYTTKAFAKRVKPEASPQKKKPKKEEAEQEFTIAMQKGESSAIIAEKALLAIGLDAAHNGQVTLDEARGSIEGYLFVGKYAQATDAQTEEVITLVLQSVCDRGWLAQGEDCIITEVGLKQLRQISAPDEVLDHVDCLMEHSDREKFVRATKQQKLLTISRDADDEECEKLKTRQEQLKSELTRIYASLKAVDARKKQADKQLGSLALDISRLRKPKTVGKRK